METNKILYVYIDHYKGVNDLEVCLDDRYEIHFDKVSNKLSIKESGNHIDGFWGKKIYSLAAIVGENGSGKTTTIRYILEAVVSGYQKEVDDNIVVMKKGGGIRVCTKREIAYECSVKYEIADYLSIPAFFYSAHFIPPNNPESIVSSQWGERYYNASAGYRLMRDYQDYSNIDTKNYIQPIFNHLLGYYAQNNFRICSLLVDHYIEMVSFDLRPPRYLQIKPNTSGVAFLQSNRRVANVDVKKFPTLNWSNPKCQALALFMYNVIVNAVVDVFRFNNDSDNNGFAEDIKDVVGNWIEIVENNTHSDAKSLIVAFNEFAKSADSKSYISYDVESMLSFINANCKFQENTFFIDIEEKTFNVKSYLNYIISTGSSIFTARFFDFAYSHDPFGETILSSGEQAMLDLYSRIYDALLISQSPLNNKIGPQLIVLDEAEIGYHPEWQRRFVKNVTQFLNSLNVPDEFFQIVLTSHSPLILSDIPLACTSYLTREDKDRPKQETFGANIFDLYHNSFFLEEGMIGEFAMEKIEKVVHLIDVWKKQGGNVASDEMKKARQVINLIANERLKDYLMDELSAIDKEGAIEYYQQKIDNLKQGKHEQN